MGSGVSDSSLLLVNSCRSVLTRKTSCLRPAHAGGGGGCCTGGGRFGGGDLGGGRFGGGFLRAVFLGVGLGVGFFGGADITQKRPMSACPAYRSAASQPWLRLSDHLDRDKFGITALPYNLLTCALRPQLVDGVASRADPVATSHLSHIRSHGCCVCVWLWLWLSS